MLELDIMNFVRKKLSALAMPQEIEFVDSLPKTRSGKIMRRVLRAIMGRRDWRYFYFGKWYVSLVYNPEFISGSQTEMSYPRKWESKFVFKVDSGSSLPDGRQGRNDNAIRNSKQYNRS